MRGSWRSLLYRYEPESLVSLFHVVQISASSSCYCMLRPIFTPLTVIPENSIERLAGRQEGRKEEIKKDALLSESELQYYLGAGAASTIRVSFIL